MTNPGARQAQQNHQQQVQHNSATFARNTAHQDYLSHQRRRGPVGVIRRVLGLVCSLVLLAVVVGIALAVLHAAQPDWFDHVKTWFDQIF